MRVLILLWVLIMSMDVSANTMFELGEKTYAKCSGCHGKSGERKALGRSKIINIMSAKQIEEALLGYQNGTYGGSMKALMRGQIEHTTDKEIRALALYIATLNKAYKARYEKQVEKKRVIKPKPKPKSRLRYQPKVSKPTELIETYTGRVSEVVVQNKQDASLKSFYMMNTFEKNGKTIYLEKLQLFFDAKKIHFDIKKGSLYERYTIKVKPYQVYKHKGAKAYLHRTVEVLSATKLGHKSTKNRKLPLSLDGKSYSGYISEVLVSNKHDAKKQAVYIMAMYDVRSRESLNYVELAFDKNSVDIDISDGAIDQKYIIKAKPHMPKDSSSSDHLALKVFSAVKSNGKLKAKHFANGLTKVKALIKNEMMIQSQAKRKNTKQRYLKSIKVYENNDLVYHLKTTPYLSKNPIVKFAYKGETHMGVLRLINVDESGIKGEIQTKLKSTERSYAPKAFEIKKQEEGVHYSDMKALQKEFASVAYIKTNQIVITAPDVASNGGSVPINIRSSLKAKSVTLFGLEEKSQMKYICQWLINERSLMDFDVKIKLNTYYDGSAYNSKESVVVVIEAEDGKYYTASKDIIVAVAGGN